MTWKIIKKSKIPILIGELIKEYEVFAPVKGKSYVSFEKISDADEAYLDSQSTRKSPKEVFLPQAEVMFTYKSDKGGLELEEPPTAERATVLIGVRPCDARGFALLDKFFSSGEYQDPYYLGRRENSITIGLACNNPLTTCFCTSLGGSPFGKEGADLLLYDVNDAYAIESTSEKGAKLIGRFPWLKDAENAIIEKAKKLSEKAEKSIRSKVPVKDLNRKLDRMFDDPVWDQTHQKCLGCGVCSYLCPTCSCFDVLEEETGEWKRVRTWDSCQFPCFTLHGSGHNPRPSGKERMRQRIMHKFSYFVKSYGQNLCVGCGRCVKECPVNLDIREVVEAISAKQVA